METNTVNILPHTITANYNNTHSVEDDDRDSIFDRDVKYADTKVNYEKVMMKPDELKNFFYLIAGAAGLQIVSGDDKTGISVNERV